MNIQVFDCEFQAIEDLENELDRLRKTALIHKQLERFVEDSMFKLDELAARFEFEEKKTGDMEGNLAILKTTISEMDTVRKKKDFFYQNFNYINQTAANVIAIEEELRKDYRLLEEEMKRKNTSDSSDNSFVASGMDSKFQFFLIKSIHESN